MDKKLHKPTSTTRATQTTSNKNGIKYCVECGDSYKSRVPTQKFCSSKCRHKEYYHRKGKEIYQRPEFKERRKNHYYKNKDKILKAQKKRRLEKIREIIKNREKKRCLECNKILCYGRYKFCSRRCTSKNYRRVNRDKIKMEEHKRYILKSEEMSLKGKIYKENNKIKKIETDKKWYSNNYDRIRMMYRIREILKGNFPHDNIKQEKILIRDIRILKERIKELEKKIEYL